MINISLEAVAAVLSGVLFIYFMHYVDKLPDHEPAPPLQADYTRKLTQPVDEDVTLDVIIKIGGETKD